MSRPTAPADDSAGPDGQKPADPPGVDWSTVTGGLAHEIRNPLSTLKVNLQLLAEDWRGAARSDPPAELADLLHRSLLRLDATRREADRMARILDDFLRFVGRHELHRAVCDLNRFVADCLDFFQPQARAAGVIPRSQLAAEPLPVVMDEQLMRQALLNLLLNALQAMPNGGELIVRTAADPQRRQARLDVIDTGTGIPADQLGRIFEAYFSTRKGGTGLGLPIARRIVDEHGGRIEVQSEPHRGSCFTIVLPLAEKS